MHSRQLCTVVALSGVLIAVVASPGHAAELSDDDLAAIAETVMTPQPGALQSSEGTTTRYATTDQNPSRGLDMCLSSTGVGIYTTTPVTSVRYTQDVRIGDAGAPNENFNLQLTETTLDISHYSSPTKAKRAWNDFVTRLLRDCAGFIHAPDVPGKDEAEDGLVWSVDEFNSVSLRPKAKSTGPLGLHTWFNKMYRSADDTGQLGENFFGNQYSSWRLAGATIVRAEYALLWAPADSAPATDPTQPIMTAKMVRAVDAMARQAARKVARKESGSGQPDFGGL